MGTLEQQSFSSNSAAALDTAIESLVLLPSFLDRSADPDQLRHLLGKRSAALDADDVARLAKKLDVQARKVTSSTARLDRLPLPATTRELVIEAMVLDKDIGFVKTGQLAEIKLEAFPFTRSGILPGTIETISNDSIENKELGLVFPAQGEVVAVIH